MYMNVNGVISFISGIDSGCLMLVVEWCSVIRLIGLVRYEIIVVIEIIVVSEF